MGMERFGDGERNQSTEQTDERIANPESERPSFSELPALNKSTMDAEDISGWKADDAERELAELPHLQEKEPKQETESKFDARQEPDFTDADIPEPGLHAETDNSEKEDVENPYYSTYEERMKQTPREDSDRGEWTEERGESDFIPNDGEVKDILEQHDKESISYKDAIPDFSEVAASTVEIDDMTDNRADNFRQCDENCAEQWNKEGRDGRADWSPRDVKEWRQENGYSWHERNDMKTCDLVPTKVNDYFGHLGGVSECRKRDAENGGNDFDE